MKSAFLLAVFQVLVGTQGFSQTRIVGYYPSWQQYVLPANAVQYQYLTHIVQAFAWPTISGGISGYSDLLSPALVSAAHGAGKKVLMAFGGWGNSDAFSPVCASADLRATFIGNLTQYLKMNGLDGVDLDWEYPKTASDRANLQTLTKEIRTAFRSIDTTWLITLAIPQGSYSGQWFDYEGMSPYVDWFNLMTYDVHGAWTNHAGPNCPLYPRGGDYDGSIDEGVKYLVNSRKVSPQKILIGLPFYGQDFTADSLYKPITGCTSVIYSSIPSRISAGWKYYWDDVAQSPFLLGSSPRHTLCYDDSLSLTAKCRYALTNSLGGVMIWALGQDVVGSAQPLMQAVGKAMKTATGVERQGTPDLAATSKILASYPNPFNSATSIHYQVARPGFVNLVVYDMLGREVIELVKETRLPGEYVVQFNASGLASGHYVSVLRVGSTLASQMLMLLK